MNAGITSSELFPFAELHTGKDLSSSDALTALRRFARKRPDVERCELCGSELTLDHAHLLDRQSKQIACSCEACAILFSGQENARFLRVPRRVVELENFALDNSTWESMMLPINLAFFVRQPDGSTAVWYPSPAGAMSSQLDLPPWSVLFAGNSVLESLQPNVEALLVNRITDQPAYCVAPIDECYRLIGLIRREWRGLSGGPRVWETIGSFFAGLRSRASHEQERPHV